MGQRGGARKGAGRKPGGATKKTREVADRLALSGDTPLEFMLNVMHCEDVPFDIRCDMSKAAAPYMHPRLSNTTLDAKVQGTINLVNEFAD